MNFDDLGPDWKWNVAGAFLLVAALTISGLLIWAFSTI